MKKVVILGGGKIGRMVGFLLGTCGDYEVRIGDLHLDTAQAAATIFGGTGVSVDLSNAAQVEAFVNDAWAVVSCAPFHCNELIAKSARIAGAHYFDLTEDVGVTRSVIALAKGAKTAFLPQCGLAPGFITIAANALAKPFAEIDSLRLRVGALPRTPSNRLGYNLTWSTEGVINEYINDCDAVRDGALVRVPALENLERLIIDGIEFEAFNTSGGLGTLAESLNGRVRNLDYKTIRFPGHCDLVKFLFQELRMSEDRAALRTMLERAIPSTTDDQVVIFVSASGMLDGRLTERVYAKRVLSQTIGGHHWTAIQITTAAGITALVDLFAEGKTPRAGLVRMEDVTLEDFIANRFGRLYS
ncbi:MAG: saccharopine dehydrogenase family protein [Phycisphaerales bacterium]|nr:saccharopine dehydrogenase family protein [Phycisphaerales bacterium]